MPNKNGKLKTVRRYDTPGRECAHADKGCCPKCLDPMATEESKRRRKAVNQITQSRAR